MCNLYIMHREPSAALIMWNSRIRRSFHLPTADTTKKQSLPFKFYPDILPLAPGCDTDSNALSSYKPCVSVHIIHHPTWWKGGGCLCSGTEPDTHQLCMVHRETLAHSHPHCRSTHPTNHRAHHHFHLKKSLFFLNHPQSPFLSCMELHNNVSPDGLLII